MAMIKCPDCKNEISDKAEHCIHCGMPSTSKTPINKNLKLQLLLSAICLITSALYAVAQYQYSNGYGLSLAEVFPFIISFTWFIVSIIRISLR